MSRFQLDCSFRCCQQSERCPNAHTSSSRTAYAEPGFGSLRSGQSNGRGVRTRRPDHPTRVPVQGALDRDRLCRGDHRREFLVDQFRYRTADSHGIAARRVHSVRLGDGRASAAIGQFLESFDGSAGAGYLEVVQDPRPPYLRPPVTEPTDEELETLEAHLRILLAQGFGSDDMGDLSQLSFPTTSLRSALRSGERRKPAGRRTKNGARVIDGGSQALREFRAAGAYVLDVHGDTIELVTFLVAHLLT